MINLNPPTPILTLPGYDGSGPEHWQTLWEKILQASRIEQRDWLHPICEEWVQTVEHAILTLNTAPILVAHSLGCLTIAHWAKHSSLKIKGALLVAPPDLEECVQNPDWHAVFKTFLPVPQKPLPFKSILVASQNDPFCKIERARHLAQSWNCDFIDVGELGHINSQSHLGEWQAGQWMLRDLIGEV